LCSDLVILHRSASTSQQATNQETITDRNGNSSTYVYDTDGNVTYDAAGNKRSETRTDDAGRALVTSFVYDDHSNLTLETDPLGNQTQYEYNVRRQVTKITDARHKITQNSYDSQGNLLSTIDPLQHTTIYKYFPNGLPFKVTDAQQNVTSFHFDGNGNMDSQTDALGNVSSFSYDTNNNKLSQTVKRTKADGSQQSLTTAYVYDASNRVVKTIYPDNSFTRTSYNSIGKQESTTDANGHVTQYGYDARGQLVQVIYPDQTQDTFGYDREGRRTDALSHGVIDTQYQYDALGRVFRTIYSNGSTPGKLVAGMRSASAYDLFYGSLSFNWLRAISGRPPRRS